MKDIFENADIVSARQRELATRNLAHILKIEQEQQNLEQTAWSIEQSIIDAHANNPTDLCDMMVVQARLLNGLFHDYLQQSHALRNKDPKIDCALRAQQQIVRTLNAWKKLKTETYTVRKLVKIYPRENFGAERTGQNAPLDV